MSPVSIPAAMIGMPHIEDIRGLALSSGKALPQSMRSLRIGKSAMPRFFVVARDGFQDQPMSFYTYQIGYTAQTLVVDAVADEKEMKGYNPDGEFLQQNHELMEQAMRRSAKIVVTHEHFDPCTGISNSPYFDEIVS